MYHHYFFFPNFSNSIISGVFQISTYITPTKCILNKFVFGCALSSIIPMDSRYFRRLVTITNRDSASDLYPLIYAGPNGTIHTHFMRLTQVKGIDCFGAGQINGYLVACSCGFGRQVYCRVLLLSVSDFYEDIAIAHFGEF